MISPASDSGSSSDLHARAQRVIPGGVNSPVRAFHSVGGDPIYIESAQGSRIRSVDGREYIDCVCSWGPLILGHAEARVVAAVQRAAEGGTSYGAPTAGECELAERIVTIVPTAEKVRLVNSGTEATMSAVRLARGATGRDRIVKFEGCYHGHSDSFLIKAGSGAATFGQPSSPGVPASVAADTLSASYNDVDSVAAIFQSNGDTIAAVIVEPVAGNMGVVLPGEGFLQSLRRITQEHGALLIFDEVITGFRVALGGAQALYAVAPDITTLGKVIGGGLPVGAYCASGALMDQMSPDGPVYQAGTLSGNPLAVAAGTATLRILQEEAPYARLGAMMDRLCGGLSASASAAAIPLTVHHVGSMAGLFFNAGPVRSYAEVAISDAGRYARFHAAMLQAGIYLAPSAFEAFFLSTAHTDEDIDAILAAASAAFAVL
jgi:glutamate-1-semialdehyde 2,1-aminomutase